jgi:hypothetical protein
MARFTDEQISQWMEAGEPFEKRSDGGGNGLYLEFHSGGKTLPSWIFRFRGAGKPLHLTLGNYPELSIEDARALVASYRKMLETGDSVVAAVGNARAADSEQQLAKTFSALLREASRHSAKRMTVTIEFESGGPAAWAS